LVVAGYLGTLGLNLVRNTFLMGALAAAGGIALAAFAIRGGSPTLIAVGVACVLVGDWLFFFGWRRRRVAKLLSAHAVTGAIWSPDMPDLHHSSHGDDPGSDFSGGPIGGGDGH